jgi:hypothetical protein
VPVEAGRRDNDSGVGKRKILWAEVRTPSGRGNDRFTIRDLLAATRCSQRVLDFVSRADVGR